MSLRVRLICLVVLTLALSLVAEGMIVFFNASRSVRTEMNSALHVAEQIVKSGLKRLPESSDQQRTVDELVAEFKGNRHLHVTLSGGTQTSVEPSLGDTYFGAPPPWFARLLGIAPFAVRFPIPIAGQDNESIVIETDPKNEVLEVWNSLGDSLLALLLFFGLSILIIYWLGLAALGPSCGCAQTGRTGGLHNDNHRQSGAGGCTASAQL
jgi:two-component system sensor histidine kinase UhpB